jgi:hypothetical protein
LISILISLPQHCGRKPVRGVKVVEPIVHPDTRHCQGRHCTEQITPASTPTVNRPLPYDAPNDFVLGDWALPPVSARSAARHSAAHRLPRSSEQSLARHSRDMGSCHRHHLNVSGSADEARSSASIDRSRIASDTSTGGVGRLIPCGQGNRVDDPLDACRSRVQSRPLQQVHTQQLLRFSCVHNCGRRQCDTTNRCHGPDV